MLFPALSKARAAAQNIKCAGNMKQMALGCTSYAGDFKEFGPVSVDTNQDKIWLQFLDGYATKSWGYAGSKGIWICPSYVGDCPQLSYGINRFIAGWSESGSIVYAVALFKVAVPSEKLYLADIINNWSFGPASTAPEVFNLRHNRRLNGACVDGHVEGVPPDPKSSNVTQPFGWPSTRVYPILTANWLD